MAGIQSKHTSGRVVLRIIVWLLVGVFGCAGIGMLCIFFTFYYPSIRADFVAARAKPRVEKIYTRIQENMPDGVRLVAEEKPKSSTYAWSLSDGAPRYAVVQGQQRYETMIVAFHDVLASYEAAFEKWGWVPVLLNDEADVISIIFRDPRDDKLWVGICTPPESASPQTPIQYVVFFEFNETSGCELTRLQCMASGYCK